ncbi:fimbrial protein [Pseudomonas sp. 8O]|uniref:fimbrial protein n=1 Tax=Pseudomonas sp. 8O TaxID=2653165 RepID=UPI0012F3FB89|nr:fimbrial protein [Pseudomonas sp. 8O]VXC36266.1 conserved exported hypothetical protein [Pseudomonas sp. 8O]
MSKFIYHRSGKRTALCAALLLATFGCATSAQAIDVYFSGSLVAPPPCVINGNTDISVDFGNEMLAGRIDGSNYVRPITFTLDCSQAVALGRAIKLQFKGDDASFKPNVLRTTNSDLAIELRLNNAFFPLNSWNLMNYPTIPAFSAVPIKAAGSTLSGGTFTAAATLLVDYQ